MTDITADTGTPYVHGRPTSPLSDPTTAIGGHVHPIDVLAPCTGCRNADPEGFVQDPRWAAILPELKELAANEARLVETSRDRLAELGAIEADLAARGVPEFVPCPACHGSKLEPTAAGLALGGLVDWVLEHRRIIGDTIRATVPKPEPRAAE